MAIILIYVSTNLQKLQIQITLYLYTCTFMYRSTSTTACMLPNTSSNLICIVTSSTILSMLYKTLTRIAKIHCSRKMQGPRLIGTCTKKMKSAIHRCSNDVTQIQIHSPAYYTHTFSKTLF
jgi:hypothetical protein